MVTPSPSSNSGFVELNEKNHVFDSNSPFDQNKRKATGTALVIL